MKKIVSILLLFLWVNGYSKDYFVSATGDDLNAGTSATTAWKTINKVNSFPTFAAGDRILFKSGEIFYGTILPKKSGTSALPVIYSYYGTGAAPIITGFKTVSGWTNLGSNIWESSAAVSSLNDANCVLINGKNTAMGRFPNTGYMTINSHVGTSTITSSSIIGSPNWVGADLVMKTWNFAIARNLITAQSAGTLTYKATTVDQGHDGYGFFIENSALTLDIQNEWYYTPSTKKIKIYGTTAPANVQISTLDTLVYMVQKNYITFDGLQFTGSNRRAFYVGSCIGITIQNCNFDYHGLYAIWGGNNHGSASSGFIFRNNTVNHINSQGIVLQNEFTGPYIGHNTFKNCGVIPGMFKVPSFAGTAQWNGAYGAIIAYRTNNLVIEYNLVDSTGYTGIHFTGNNTRVNNNEVSHHCLLMMDGGGIYTWTGVSGTPSTGSKIYNNLVHDGYGNNEGTTEPNRLCQGLYLDENTRNTEVYGNSFFNNPYGGIFSNANTNCNIHHNTCYNNVLNQILYSNNYNSTAEAERLNTVKNNIFFSKTATQYVAKMTTKTNDFNQFFTVCDSNYYCRPIDENRIIYTANNNVTHSYYTIEQWKAAYAYDQHSKKFPIKITNTSDILFEYNGSASAKTILLHTTYIDIKGSVYFGSLTLQPYTSIILVRTGAAFNIDPVADAGDDKVVNL